MSEIVVIGVITVVPGKEAEAEQMLGRVAAQTHREEGCLSYALHRGLDEPNTLVLVERWRSRADLDAHFAQPYLAELMTQLPELISEVAPLIVFTEPVPVGEAGKGRLGAA